MPVKVTENTTTSSSRTEEYVEKTHGEKVSDGMKEYWKEKKLAEKQAEIDKLQKKVEKLKQENKELKSGQQTLCHLAMSAYKIGKVV